MGRRLGFPNQHDADDFDDDEEDARDHLQQDHVRRDYAARSFSQPPVHLGFALAIELDAHPKITQILSFSWGFSSKVEFCTP